MYSWINIIDTFYVLYVEDVFELSVDLFVISSLKQYNDCIDNNIGTDSKINLKPFAKSKCA